MKLLCDEMLKGLARWLRAAGHDVEMAPDGSPDRLLIDCAARDGRLLLTRDRQLLAIRGASSVVVLLSGVDLEGCVREVDRKLGIDWLHAPFSRCLLCNTRLVDSAPPPELPPDVGRVCRCPRCSKTYWHGGHVRRMRQRLERWQLIKAP
ncbi:MAG: DUF5615 family PIN-like protein [Candidatus Accumulibacter sp.]|uniref:DUF5615 family PIN-like protein n=1 Tax=Accumulibacter sp. TaxID=2053492 RepID=UPI0019FDB679|nr:DUF5615 family PIN-like protein [Accumulibacter sp.]MBE2259925.1 DUF5615 family PIN-like protein [Paracoccaceae bacterium]MCB1943084.1 DUF5615 family PIN-like protein [Accumulibacter sp.]MCP5248258.1 DUF5615 family PIN-like protein [Accumulibacter sp.]